jgi:hypothetical protein
MQRIVAMEDTAERGQFADLQWFWHYMERTDVTARVARARAGPRSSTRSTGRSAPSIAPSP